MDKLLFKRIIIGLLSILILSYIGYLLISSNITKAVDVEEAVSNTVSDVIHTEGYIIRDENYITNDSDGVLSYDVTDGDKISVGQTIADIYKNETDAVYRQQIKDINNQISSLRMLSESYYKDSVSLETVNSQIENNIFSILNNVNQGKYSDAKSINHDLLLSICERQMITGNVKDFSEKRTQLKQKKTDLEAQCSESYGTVTSDKAGYFISHPDGYESTFDYNKVNKITLDDLKNAKSKKLSDNVVGKVVVDPDWYIACKVSADDTVELAKLQNSGATIYVQMPSVTTEKIPVTIHSINQKSKKDDGVLVLCCDYMNNYISSSRHEKVEITTVSYSGLKVAKRAVHEDTVKRTKKDKKGNKITETKRVQGVYILHGSEIRFKEIRITYSGSDYVLCDPEPEDDTLFSGETIELYDQVVVRGDNLYDGKIIR